MTFMEARKIEKELTPVLERLLRERGALYGLRNRTKIKEQQVIREAEQRIEAAEMRCAIFMENKIHPIESRLVEARDKLRELFNDPGAEAREQKAAEYLQKLRAGKLYPVRGADVSLDMALDLFEEEVRQLFRWQVLNEIEKPACADLYGPRRIAEIVGQEAA